MQCRILRILLALGLCLLIALAFDAYVLRGYFLIRNFYKKPYEIFEGSLDFQVAQTKGGNWNLKMKNQDILFHPITLYRDNAVFFDLNDSVLLNYATRIRVSDEGHRIIYEDEGGFDCGTGIGSAYIRPLEAFELSATPFDRLVDQYTAHWILYQLIEIKKIDITPETKLYGQFYLPVFSFGAEATRVYSNRFPLPTNEMLKMYAELEE